MKCHLLNILAHKASFFSTKLIILTLENPNLVTQKLHHVLSLADIQYKEKRFINKCQKLPF
jgi:hypothetical protein